jgi:hypothetical protein
MGGGLKSLDMIAEDFERCRQRHREQGTRNAPHRTHEQDERFRGDDTDLGLKTAPKPDGTIPYALAKRDSTPEFLSGFKEMRDYGRCSTVLPVPPTSDSERQAGMGCLTPLETPQESNP